MGGRSSRAKEGIAQRRRARQWVDVDCACQVSPGPAAGCSLHDVDGAEAGM